MFTKFWNIFCFLFLLQSVVVVKIFAEPANSSSNEDTLKVYLWDNVEGLVSASSCKISYILDHESHLKVSDNDSLYTDIKNNNLENIGQLLQGSIVKTSPSAKSSEKDYQKIEVVSQNFAAIPQDSVVLYDSSKQTNRNKNRIMGRGEDGLVNNSALRSIDAFKFLLGDKTPGSQHEHLQLKGKELKVISPDVMNKELTSIWCPNQNRTYLAFMVTNPAKAKQGNSQDLDNSIEAVIGVYHDETSLFSDASSSLKNEYKQVSDSKLDSADTNDTSSNNVNTINTKLDLDSNNDSKKLEDLKKEEPIDVITNKKSEIDQASEEKGSGSFEYLICTDTNVNVRDRKLAFKFRAQRYSHITLFQGEDSSFEGEIGGKTYTFQKVKFTEAEAQDRKIGYIAQDFISLKSNCEVKELTLLEKIVEDISGIHDEDCCVFPTIKWPTHNYKTGMRRFGARRSSGRRSHAATDLYRFDKEKVVSLAPGEVLRGPQRFYEGTCVVDVLYAENGNSFVVRYGEIYCNAPVKAGTKLKKGQMIGKIKPVNSGCCMPMLHFELYHNNGYSKKTCLRGGGKFKRRADLIDPTKYLDSWGLRQFGKEF